MDYTWQLWKNPLFKAGNPQAVNLISAAEVSADQLSITFHLQHAFAPFLAFWVGSDFAPLPAYHFRTMTPQAVVQSPDRLNPSVTSGPFLMAERQPGDHYTVVRNPRYYRAHEGLPDLDKIVFRLVEEEALLQDMVAGTIDSAFDLDVSKAPLYQHLRNYTLVTPPTDTEFEGLFFKSDHTNLGS